MRKGEQGKGLETKEERGRQVEVVREETVDEAYL